MIETELYIDWFQMSYKHMYKNQIYFQFDIDLTCCEWV